MVVEAAAQLIEQLVIGQAVSEDRGRDSYGRARVRERPLSPAGHRSQRSRIFPVPVRTVPIPAAAPPSWATASAARSGATPNNSPPEVWASASNSTSSSAKAPASRVGATQSRFRRLPPGRKPAVASSRTPASKGTAGEANGAAPPPAAGLFFRGAGR